MIKKLIFNLLLAVYISVSVCVIATEAEVNALSKDYLNDQTENDIEIDTQLDHEVLIEQEEQEDETTVSLTPRSVVRVFMSNMERVAKGDRESESEVLRTLVLDQIDENKRDIVGIALAESLYKILNHFTFSVGSLPEETDVEIYKLPPGQEEGIEIVVALQEDGNWRFCYENTLSRLDEYIEIIEEKEKPDDLTVDPILRSPRATMRAFLDRMSRVRSEGYDQVIKTLDLSAVERSIRNDIGRERAAMMQFVIDRYKYIDLVEIPNETDGLAYRFLSHEVGEIVIDRVVCPDSEISAWKFTSRTVDSLPALYDAFRNRPLVEGVESDVDIPLSVRIRDYMNNLFPGLVRTTFFVENWQWLGILFVITLGVIISGLLKKSAQAAVDSIFKHKNLTIDQSVRDSFLKPFKVFLVFFIWWFGFSLLGLPNVIRMFFVQFTRIIATIFAIISLFKVIDVLNNYLMGKALKTANKFDDLLVPLISKALKTFVVAIGFIVIADLLAFDVNKILAGLGIGGLAFALAAQDTISNLFGSITILVDRPFQIGDWITIGAVDGTVESVGVRSTRVRTFHNSLVTVPNSQLINASIDNWGAREFRRITCDIGIAYDTPPAKIDAFCEGIRELIRLHPYTRKDFYIVNLNNFANNCLQIMLYCFVKAPDWGTELREKHRLFNDIIKLAGKIGVEFACSPQTVYLRNDKKMSHDNVDFQTVLQKGKVGAETIVYDSLGKPIKIPPPVEY